MNEELRTLGYTDEQLAAVSASIKMTMTGPAFSAPCGETTKNAYAALRLSNAEVAAIRAPSDSL